MEAGRLDRRPHSGWMVFTAGFLGAIVVCSVQLLDGALVFGRHALGQAIALVLAGPGVIVHFLALGAHPVWSVTT